MHGNRKGMSFWHLHLFETEKMKTWEEERGKALTVPLKRIGVTTSQSMSKGVWRFDDGDGDWTGAEENLPTRYTLKLTLIRDFIYIKRRPAKLVAISVQAEPAAHMNIYLQTALKSSLSFPPPQESLVVIRPSKPDRAWCSILFLLPWFPSSSQRDNDLMYTSAFKHLNSLTSHGVIIKSAWDSKMLAKCLCSLLLAFY